MQNSRPPVSSWFIDFSICRCESIVLVLTISCRLKCGTFQQMCHLAPALDDSYRRLWRYRSQDVPTVINLLGFFCFCLFVVVFCVFVFFRSDVHLQCWGVGQWCISKSCMWCSGKQCFDPYTLLLCFSVFETSQFYSHSCPTTCCNRLKFLYVLNTI